MVHTGTSYRLLSFILPCGDVYGAQRVLLYFLVVVAENYYSQTIKILCASQNVLTTLNPNPYNYYKKIPSKQAKSCHA